MVKQNPKVVAIGGGTGLSVILRGLKQHPLDITAIVTVADDGGSSGILRHELKMPPPGDIRNVIAALAETEPLFEELLQHRFTDGNGLSGHSLGNLLLAAMTNITGDFATGIRELSRVLNVKGRVLPAANQSILLNAVMTDGSVVQGESAIPTHNKKIERVFLSPSDVHPLQESLEAIREADLIVIGPGSLYTSVLPNLLVPQLGEEICRSEAKKIYICNVMTQQGETDAYTASDHIEALSNHLPNPGSCIDYVFVNNREVPDDILKLYALEGATPVLYDRQRLESFGFNLVSDHLVKFDRSIIRHDEDKIAKNLMSVLRLSDPTV